MTRMRGPAREDTQGRAKSIAERRFGLVLLACAIPFVVQAVQLDFLADDGTIGPGFFPILLSVGMLVLLASYVVVAHRDGTTGNSSEGARAWRNQVVIVGGIFGIVLVGPYLSALIALGLFLLFSLVVVERLSWLRAILLSVTSCAALYAIFEVWLGLNISNGIFG